MIDDLDHRLIAILRANSRTPRARRTRSVHTIGHSQLGEHALIHMRPEHWLSADLGGG